MNYELKDAIKKWDADVEAEAVKLIQNGVPPYDAMERARNTISRRRQLKEHGNG
jgi:hypothetical protein